MRVVIAPDKFKGSLSAPDVARHLEAGLQAAARTDGRIGNLEIVRIPVADGGEGTLDDAPLLADFLAAARAAKTA